MTRAQAARPPGAALVATVTSNCLILGPWRPRGRRPHAPVAGYVIARAPAPRASRI